MEAAHVAGTANSWVTSAGIAPSSAEAVVANHTGLSNHSPLQELVHEWTEHECPDPLESDEISACDNNVHGRLLHCIAFWENIGASDFVLRIIRYGYFFVFCLPPPPPQFRACNLKSSNDHSSFVSDQIRMLLRSGAVDMVEENATHVISVLGVVPKGNGKLRLIIDLRFLNKHLADSHFSVEDLRLIPDLFDPGCFLFTFDLKDGYHHISIAPEHRKFLGFQWQFRGQARFFVFAALPFGLKPAPFVFTKVLRPLVTHWRDQGIRIFLYLDDGTGAANSAEETQRVAQLVRSDLEKCGLVINK